MKENLSPPVSIELGWAKATEVEAEEPMLLLGPTSTQLDLAKVEIRA